MDNSADEDIESVASTEKSICARSTGVLKSLKQP